MTSHGHLALFTRSAIASSCTNPTPGVKYSRSEASSPACPKLSGFEARCFAYDSHRSA